MIVPLALIFYLSAPKKKILRAQHKVLGIKDLKVCSAKKLSRAKHFVERLNLLNFVCRKFSAWRTYRGVQEKEKEKERGNERKSDKRK